MTVTALPGFRSLVTCHCVTGSMRQVYAFHGDGISEEMLLGLGDGVGFIYWHMRGAPPMLGGRANVGRPGEAGLERLAGRRTGVAVESRETASAARAEAALLEALAGGEPVMVQVDMGELGYLGMPAGYHFGGHVVVVAGADPESRTALVADRDAPLHAVSLDELDRARGSPCRPWPPRRRWWSFDFSAVREPRAAEVREAIAETATAMLEAPIANLGVRGIRTAATRIRGWPAALGARGLTAACINGFTMIDARGGTGGGCFRSMYATFLKEAAMITSEPAFACAGAAMAEIASSWQEVAEALQGAATAAQPEPWLARGAGLLAQIADREEAAWAGLRQLAGGRPAVRPLAEPSGRTG